MLRIEILATLSRKATLEYTKSCLEYSQYLIDSTGTFINPLVQDEGNNLGNRPYLLDSYRELVDYINKNDIDIETSAHGS